MFPCFCALFSEAYTGRMKTYKAILLAVGGLIIVVGGAYYFAGGRLQKPVEQVKVRANTRAFTGQVTRIYEGENKAVYSFYIPEDATTTILMDEALIRVKEGNALYLAAYLSYEGGRGYVPEEYINRIIAPQVRALTVTGTSTIGSYTWMEAESEHTEWHVAQVGDGQWLMVVENPKANHDRILEVLDEMQVE